VANRQEGAAPPSACTRFCHICSAMHAQVMPSTSSTGVTVPTAFVVELKAFHSLNLARPGDLMFD
jgi:hypothetical protein